VLENCPPEESSIVSKACSAWSDIADMRAITRTGQPYGRGCTWMKRTGWACWAHGAGAAEHLGRAGHMDIVMGTFQQIAASWADSSPRDRTVIDYLKHHRAAVRVFGQLPAGVGGGGGSRAGHHAARAGAAAERAAGGPDAPR